MSNLSDETLKILFEKAKEAKERAYSPYSQFRVGACILTKDGQYIKGCNVENASYGLTVCAERNALCTMITEGIKELTHIAVTTDVKDSLTYPCGMCIQFLLEFGKDIEVILFSPEGDRKVVRKVRELAPYGFCPSDLDLEKIDHPKVEVLKNQK